MVQVKTFWIEKNYLFSKTIKPLWKKLWVLFPFSDYIGICEFILQFVKNTYSNICTNRLIICYTEYNCWVKDSKACYKI